MATKISPPSSVKVKKEITSDEIKDFAETAMNELLGWYGYENNDRNIDGNVIRGTTINYNNNNKILNLRSTTRARSSTPENDSSRENSKSPQLMHVSVAEKDDIDCGWCRRPVPQHSPESLGTPEGPRYCSEKCFAQSRRASFKRAKTCDWCRHVRHAVSYVDFQDGASQLQFCSDKCLNQYKMQIFCKETQAHLDMNPHLKEKGNTSGSLITPELWLKNCRSRSTSPISDRSRSISPQLNVTTITNALPAKLAQTSRPLISVAPPSKLLCRPMPTSHHNRQSSVKSMRRRRSARIGTPVQNSTNTSSTNNNNILMVNHNNNGSGIPKNCTLTNAQDLRLNMPNVSPSIDQTTGTTATLRPAYQHSFLPPPPNLYPLRSPLISPPPRLLPPHNSSQLPHQPTMDSHYQQQHLRGFPFGTAPPPITILVPYPIVLPLPIPIPIPLPISEFLKAAQSRLSNIEVEKKSPTTSEGQTPILVPPETHPIVSHPQPQISSVTSISQEQPNNDDHHDDQPIDMPLDFTKSRKKKSEIAIIEVVPPPSGTPTIATTNNDEKTESGCDEVNPEQKLPKFKITRLHSKRILTKELESNRPLRKRKRVIDANN